MRIVSGPKSLKAFAACFVLTLALASQSTRLPAHEGSCGTMCLYYCPNDPHWYCQMQYGGLCGLRATCESEEPCIPGLTIKLKCGVGEEM